MSKRMTETKTITKTARNHPLFDLPVYSDPIVSYTVDVGDCEFETFEYKLSEYPNHYVQTLLREHGTKERVAELLSGWAESPYMVPSDKEMDGVQTAFTGLVHCYFRNLGATDTNAQYLCDIVWNVLCFMEVD